MQEVFEKIRERLEEKLKEPQYQHHGDNYYVGIYDAIEIVNQVAEEYSNSEIPNMSEKPTSSNEFCEWKCDALGFIINPHTKWMFNNEPRMKNVYCNTCGKKIIVAPYQPKGDQKDCNTCANYTEPDEIDNGCYMCCKGLEDNYKPKGEK